ncbi:MAG: restriction endonuclease [Methanobrevibacter sp.]|nr:restriction endonuclease [Methanobrevibacter sp.]
MEKQQLVNFIAKVMEDAGFKVYKDFKTSQQIVDIYAVLPTAMGDFGIVVACKNYDKQWEVGVDILKEMEIVGRSIKASKVAIVTSSNFSQQARKYASRRNIKLIDRDNLMVLAKKFSKKSKIDSKKSVETSSDDYSHYNNDTNSGYDYVDTDSGVNSVNSAYDYDGGTYISGKSNVGLGRFGSRANNNNNQKSFFSGLGKKTSNEGPSLLTIIKPVLNNTIVSILFVVVVSHIVSLFLQILFNAPAGVIGLVKIISALILSYGLVLVLNKDGTIVLVKGTTVFFVSLVILILMIILL